MLKFAAILLVQALLGCVKVGPPQAPVVYLQVKVAETDESRFLEVISEYADEQHFQVQISGPIGPNQEQRAFRLMRRDVEISGQNPFGEGFKIGFFETSKADGGEDPIRAAADNFKSKLGKEGFDTTELRARN